MDKFFDEIRLNNNIKSRYYLPSLSITMSVCGVWVSLEYVTFSFGGISIVFTKFMDNLSGFLLLTKEIYIEKLKNYDN